MSEKEALEGLRERWRVKCCLDEGTCSCHEDCADELDKVLAAYPVGVPSIPPLGRDNPSYRTDKFEKLVSDVCNAAAFFTMEYNEARARGERLSYGVDSKIRPILTAALAEGQMSSTLCPKTPEGKEQE